MVLVALRSKGLWTKDDLLRSYDEFKGIEGNGNNEIGGLAREIVD